MLLPELEKYVSLKYKTHTTIDYDNKVIRDILSAIGTDISVLEIENIVVDRCMRGNRLGVKSILDLVSKHEDKLIVITIKFYNPDRDLKTKREVIDSVISLAKYFSSMGFIDVNKYFGKYSDRISMIYMNKKYQEIFE